MTKKAPVTVRLRAWSAGDQAAFGDVVELIHTELRALARQAMAGERASHTLQPTALLHEAYLKLSRLKTFKWENRAAFLAFAGKIMRQVLVEHARAVGAVKRGGGGRRVDLTDVELVEEPRIDVIDLHRALNQLEEYDSELVRLVELRFFAGLSEVEAAEALGLARATVQRRWSVGKRLLVRLLSENEERGLDEP